MTNDKQQTAVEWLFLNLKSHFEHDGDLLEVVQMSYEQAKEMEKEQHRVTAQDFYYASHSFKNFEQYYEQTYGGDEQ
jgi:hypothetical protein